MNHVFEVWGKLSKEHAQLRHPLIYHLLDTAAVASSLWDHCLSESFKISLSNTFDQGVEEMGKNLGFWVALHDIGKAGPEFQKKSPIWQQRLTNLGFTFPDSLFSTTGFHATASAIILRRIFETDMPGLPRKFRNGLAGALGGHHGEFPDDNQLINPAILKAHVGDAQWMELQHQIYETLKSSLSPHCPLACPDDLATLNPIFLLLTGLTTTSDWIASNDTFFDYFPNEIEFSEYYSISLTKAQNALETLGWLGWKAINHPLSFSELFPGFSPNGMQQKVIELSRGLHSPFLAIIEAATGSGKTEAALYLADTVLQSDQKAGIYVAMPTQATSNQMYTRVRQFLATRYKEDAINLHLVHGASLLMAGKKEFEPQNIWSDEGEKESNIHSHTWFLPRKKTLLAPFGVGTVDQTFLSVLRSRHFFLRLFGLSHKVLIFDEVHAYDTYMTEIFKSLLHWLKAVGTSVIILTATLPETTRRVLLESYSGSGYQPLSVAYPRISVASPAGIEVVNAGVEPSRDITLRWIDRDPAGIINILKSQLAHGGCAAVICNTVNRVLELNRTIKEAFAGDEIEIIVFHSRFPHLWRDEIEDRVKRFFGKDRASRPSKAILIATQLIEQSLDLDFDLLITDLPPVDLLIQRIGRLHRHQHLHPSPIRPPLLQQPQCFIAAPPIEQTPPDFGADKYVYASYILAKTQLALANKNKLSLPAEIDDLIKQVYEDEPSASLPPGLRDGLLNAKKTMQRDHADSRTNALNYLIPATDRKFIGSLATFFGDNPASLSRKIVAAPTREIAPSVEIVCFTNESDGIHILGDPQPLVPTAPLTKVQIQKCLEAGITVTNDRVVKYFLNSDKNRWQAFSDVSALRWHFVAVFSNNTFQANEFSLLLDQKCGLSIQITA